MVVATSKKPLSLPCKLSKELQSSISAELDCRGTLHSLVDQSRFDMFFAGMSREDNNEPIDEGPSRRRDRRQQGYRDRGAESGAKVAILARAAADLKAACERLAKDGSCYATTSATYPRPPVSPRPTTSSSAISARSTCSSTTPGLARGTPMGRIGTAEEFANLACFLASEQGSYITGTAINVDGGRSPVV